MNGKWLVGDSVENYFRFAFITNFDRFAVPLCQFCLELGWLTGCKPSEDMPVFFRLELFDRLLTITNQSQSHRLHPTCA